MRRTLAADPPRPWPSGRSASARARPRPSRAALQCDICLLLKEHGWPPSLRNVTFTVLGAPSSLTLHGPRRAFAYLRFVPGNQPHPSAITLHLFSASLPADYRRYLFHPRNSSTGHLPLYSYQPVTHPSRLLTPTWLWETCTNYRMLSGSLLDFPYPQHING